MPDLHWEPPTNADEANKLLHDVLAPLQAGLGWHETNGDPETRMRWRRWVHLPLTAAADVAEFLAGVAYGYFGGSGGGPK